MVKCRMPVVLMVSEAETSGVASAVSLIGMLRPWRAEGWPSRSESPTAGRLLQPPFRHCGARTASLQRPDVEIARDAVEGFAQRLRHRDAVGAAFEELGVALLARQPDAVDTGQPRLIAEV